MMGRELQQLMRAAVAHHQSGRLGEAERIYRQILAAQPNQPDALHLLGAIAAETGKLDQAIDLITKAVRLQPNQTVYLCNLSEMYRRAGRFDEALALGRDAARVDPKLARAYSCVASALTHLRRSDEAVAAFRKAIELKPDYADAHAQLGNTLHSIGQYNDAIAVFRRLCELNPNSVEALCGMAAALRESGRPRDAIEALRKAIAIRPDFAPAFNNLGIALSQLDLLDDAVATFRKASQLQPNQALPVKNLGVALAEQGKFDESLAALDTAIALQPDMAEAHGNRALMLLVKGDFERGWAEYEWRWRAQLTMLSIPRNFPQPRWDGSPLSGKTILLHAEQGFGDTIQFVRYLPMVAARGARILLECPIELVALLQRAPAVHRVVPAGQSLPPFDCHCPLLSLPLVFGTRLESIPAPIPYLAPLPEKAATWKAKIDALGSARKVGVVWAGNPKNKLDRKRSIPLPKLSLFAAIPGVQWISLQKGASASPQPQESLPLVDWTNELRNFDDTAALISNLDCVVSVDTAVAHLAGAMGKRVLLMLPYVPDWRWLLNRFDSPWYPTMRLFRQSTLGNWDEVIRAVATELADRK